MEKRVATSREMKDDQLVIFFREFLKVILIIFCVLLIIRFVFNQDITNFLAGLSLAGAAIALAAKESLENLIASFIIFFDKPFSVGDLLKVNQVNGTVEKIGLRSTRIRTLEETYVTIPNKQMVDSVVDNLSLRNKRRAELILNLSLITPSAQLTQLVKKIDELLTNQKVTDKAVLLSDIKIDAYVIIIEYYTEVITISDFNLLKQQINFLILELLELEGVDIAGKDKPIAPRLR
jgi:MscS family membrane protein